MVPTALERNAPGIVRHDAERPKHAPDDAQRQRGGWPLKQRSATRSSAIGFDGRTVVVRSRLSPRCAKPQRGARVADKTRQALVCEPLRPQRTPMRVYAGSHGAIVETRRFVQMVWPLSPPEQERFRTGLAEHLNHIQKRE